MLLLFSHSVVFDSLVTPWTVACQAPLAMGFPRQEYWSGILISLFIDHEKFDSILTLNISFTSFLTLRFLKF